MMSCDEEQERVDMAIPGTGFSALEPQFVL